MYTAYFKNQRLQILFFTFFVFLLLLFPNKNLHLVVNSFHTHFFDVFFKYVTYLGDGVLFAVFMIFFLFIKRKQSLKFAIAGITTLLVTFVLKKVVFTKFPRPVEFFGEEKLHLIEGVKMHHWNSFPSGHSMAAFAMFTLFFLYVKNPVLKGMFLTIASLAAFSRVYLSQHFLLDILVGSMIGVGIALVSDYWGVQLMKSIKRRKKKSKNRFFKTIS